MDMHDVVGEHRMPPTREDRFGRRFANEAAAGIAAAESVTARFAEVVARRRDALAVEQGGERWTYGMLAARAGRIADAMRRAGCADEEPVALLYPHGASMIAAIFGVLGAGKFYVPLIADHPLPHLQAVVRECGCRIVLAAPEFADLAAGLGVAVRVIDDASLPAAAIALRARRADAITYLLFTSGTTGVPKGVMQCDRNVLHHAACYASSIGLEAGDRMTLLPYYAFDASVMDIFATLLTGASLHLWDVRRRGVEGIGDWLDRERITIWHSTPSVLRAAFPTFARPAALRWVVLGGEAAVGGDVALVARHGGPRCGLINGLGPTECTTALQYVADPVADVTAARLPVGRPVPGIEAALLDAQGQPGAEEGELAIASPFVALGYWNRPELTAERFGEARGDTGVRSYRTGDVLRLNANGCYEHLSRVDDQIKIRGMRVELGEIQAALVAHDDVLQAVVLPHTDAHTGQTTIAAYVVPRDPSCVAALREYVAARLPAYMIPGAIVPLEAMPLLPNGKLDRRALPDPRAQASATPRKAPRTPLQRLLATCWSDVLRRDAVGIDENFFELGGDSLLGTQLLARIRRDLEIEAQLGDLFRHPTVEALAAHLLDAR
ncbi:non-ribosomal peptide synthetase [Burkholderia ubonensis]|uniref:Peptide synthetase n=1 Tax=Burkholderia ubonensis subsp. mesacidophila TaxID=265293 RepID=A0A2A4FMR7_9BURK|nr:non-ribosomal peptide synthetase [Burkholderia ubonensis]PCE33706.1 peptide synthetase [Burkholderia ubonensis subsp. mesacidophila]